MFQKIKNYLILKNSENYEEHIAKIVELEKRSRKIKLRLIIDKYSVEIFVNDGEQVMTSTFYTDLDATDISFYAKGNATINVEKHDIIIK